MTASPTKVNGTTRSAVPVLGPWQPITRDGIATVWEKQPAAEPETTDAAETAPMSAIDPVAEAEAEAIRAKARVDAEAARIEAEAKAKAIEIKAADEAERLRLANERQRMALEEKQAAHARRLAEIKAEQEEVDRRAAVARKKAEAESKAEAEAADAIADADARWRRYALGFYIVCAVVALPVQIAAFWSPSAPWLVIAPLMLEGGAAVVLKGAAAAVAGHRPHWHYRLIAWLLAFIAASVNLWHGINAFDPATAIGTAFASVAGPGVWDLHEHGRIRKRDGALTRRQRRAEKAEQKRVAAIEAAEKKAADEAKEAAARAADEAARKLAEARAKEYPKVWEHALKLAAALGEATVTAAVWKRAYNDIEGTDPGDSVDVIRTRNVAARRVAAARSEAPGNTPSKVTNAQRAAQVIPGSVKPRIKPVPPRRKRNDTPKFHPVARSLAADSKRQSIAEKQATANPSKES